LYLDITGRSKEMIIRGGENIYPKEIEEVIYKHPAILDCAIVGFPDKVSPFPFPFPFLLYLN
jgi:acyl-CoA synthetase (AMP-forming)/AMP-acid ligase II